MEPDCGGEVEVRKDIAADDNEPLVKKRTGVADTTGGPKIRLGSQVLHGDTEPMAVIEVAGDDLRLVVKGRDHVGDPMLLQKLDDMLHHRLVEHWNHRLWDVTGKRPEAGTESSRHDYGFHQNVVLEL